MKNTIDTTSVVLQRKYNSEKIYCLQLGKLTTEGLQDLAKLVRYGYEILGEEGLKGNWRFHH